MKKIYCDKCGEDISADIDVKFDKMLVGHVVCPKCHKENKRYISETDLLLYLGISESFYLIISIITKYVFNLVKPIWLLIVLLLAIFIAAFMIQKIIDRIVYEKAYMKQETKDKEFDDNKDQISRSLIWQSMLFLALAITYVTGTEFSIFFLLISIAAIVLTFIKFYLSAKKEKSIK